VTTILCSEEGTEARHLCIAVQSFMVFLRESIQKLRFINGTNRWPLEIS